MSVQDGKIQLGNIQFDKSVNANEFKSKYSDFIAQEEEGGKDFINFLIYPQKIDNLYAILRVYFYKEKLHMIVLRMNNQDSFPSWDDVDMRGLVDEKRAYDSILLKKLGKPPYKYSWGTISTSCDVRGGDSNIIISYN